MKFNFIKTERLTIRRLKIEDAKAISIYRSAPEVAEFQSWENYSKPEAIKLIEKLKNSNPTNKGEWFQFGIEHSKTGELLGDIGFLNEDKNGKSWIGFTLDSKYWQQGFAHEAVSEILSYYLQIGASDVWASIDPVNISSKKLLEKLGFGLNESKPDDLIFNKKNILKK